MSEKQKGARAAMAALFERISGGVKSIGAAKGRLARTAAKKEATSEVVGELVGDVSRAKQQLANAVDDTIEVLETFLKSAKMKRQATGSFSIEREIALTKNVAPVDPTDAPVRLKAQDKRVIAEKHDISERARELETEKLNNKSLSKKERARIQAEADLLYNFGIQAKHNTSLGYFLGNRFPSGKASAEEIELARAAFKVRERLMDEFHAAVLGKQKAFLKEMADKVAAACRPLSDEREIRNKAKEILRDEFAKMRQTALDEVLGSSSVKGQMEKLGLVIKKPGDDIRAPRIYFQVKLQGETYKIGFDIDHSLLGFAEARDDFLQEVFTAKGKVIPEKLVPIFDPGNFTLETARNNQVMLEGIRKEQFQTAKLSPPPTKAIKKVDDSVAADLKEIEKARARLREVFDVVSKLEDSRVKDDLLDSLWELESVLGDSL